MSKITQAPWSRRAMLEGGLLAGASMLLPHQSWAADADAIMATLSKRPLISKVIPSSGERIPAVGIGTNAFFLKDYEQLKAVLKQMYDMSGSMIDTSDDYPHPNTEESELVIGKALAELRARRRMFLATKFNAEGFQTPQTPLDRAYGQEAFDRSLKRLQTDIIDLAYVHHPASIDPLMPWLQDLKKAGKVRYIGITMLRQPDQAEIAEKMRQYPIDFVQFPYSIGARDAEQVLLPLAIERKIAVTLDVPLRGLGAALKQPLPSWAADIDVTSWAQFMLKWAISHPGVTCAIPGSTSVDHLIDNQLAARGRLPDAAMRKKMQDYWDAMPKGTAAS